jgi:PhnB protein
MIVRLVDRGDRGIVTAAPGTGVPIRMRPRRHAGFKHEEKTVMKMNTYVNFAGTCAEALRFYEQHLGGQIGMMMTHDQAPDQTRVQPEWKHAVLHARITIGGTDLLAADIPGAEPMRSAYLTLAVDSDAEAERVFAALSDGGRALMPMQETFFATRFGQVRDRFGLNWMVLCERAAAAGNAADPVAS